MFEFRLLTEDDLPLLFEWLNRPHVAEWWHSAASIAEVAETYLPRTKSPSDGEPYLAFLGQRPVAYIQWYPAMDFGTGVVGIDQFLSDPKDLGRGLGTALARQFAESLFTNPDVTRIVVDPSPDNLRAIRCYEKSGFRFVARITTPDGPAHLMALDRG
jgi:RimJ/RimL family protein N-acetyltransferase